MKAKDLPAPAFKYKGCSYHPVESLDEEKDLYSITHYVVKEGVSKAVEADFTPYCKMSRIDFQTFVDLGFPKRTQSYRSLSAHDLRKWRGSLRVTNN